jgi:hypothetical protein
VQADLEGQVFVVALGVQALQLTFQALKLGAPSQGAIAATAR